MSGLSALRKEIRQLKCNLSSSQQSLDILIHFGSTDKPHGFLHGQHIIISPGSPVQYRAATDKEEFDFQKDLPKSLWNKCTCSEHQNYNPTYESSP